MTDTSRTAQRPTEMLAVVDGELMPLDQAAVPATDLGLVRGDGVFEVVQLYEGQLFALDEHLARLSRSAVAIDLDLPLEQIEADVALLLGAVGAQDGNVRIIVTRSGTRLVMQEPVLVAPAALRLALVPHLVTPLLSGVKSLSYALNCHARRVAQAAGCDDALLFSADDGQILEAPFTSFAWVEDGRLYTPPLAAGILDSITRRVLFEATDVEERVCRRENLARAEGACIMGTGLEIVPVSEIRDVRTFAGVAEPIRAAAAAMSEAIQARLRQAVGAPLVSASLEKEDRWRTQGPAGH
jgi:branched-chain amino acid aminotransferase